MRDAFCQSLLAEAADENLIFLTGDLGYRALEALRDRLGNRFINAGVAEQNMVSVAAGLAKCGFRPWVYSIAPFIYARALEQIRNDVCLHNLPVVMVGNGGGYGYGVMGATHHALEDYGILLTLPRLTVHLPAFDSDLPEIASELLKVSSPSYLRLGLEEQPKTWSAPKYARWRKLLSGDGPTVIAVGPMAGAAWGQWQPLPQERRPTLWCLSTLPFNELPDELWQDLRSASAVAITEEHVAQGSAGAMLAQLLISQGWAPQRFRHFTAQGYPSGRYGSQAFHRRECGLMPDQILSSLLN